MQQIRPFIKENKRYLLASFLIPFGIMALIYLTMGIYPGSSRSVLASDAFSQFSNFHASFRNAMLGKQSFFYTWNASLGLNYWALISYYLVALKDLYFVCSLKRLVNVENSNGMNGCY